MRLEWIWRIGQEPGRLWNRYFVEAFWLAHAIFEQFVSQPQTLSHRSGKEFVK
jgi:UDP-N-acetyl-D-mannosaminuronic acid transferase (WecB/TagA/CpsF family)